MHLTQIVLPNLAIVRGNRLIQCNRNRGLCSLYVVVQDGLHSRPENLGFLSFPKLKEISRGGVYISSSDLCFVHLVNFADIMQYDSNDEYPLIVTNTGNSRRCKDLMEEGKITCGYDEKNSTTQSFPADPSLPFFSTNLTWQPDPVCESGHCWGPKREDCQTLTRLICSDKCKRPESMSGRCFGPGDSECCHENCAAGCSGDFKSECNACRFLKSGEKCVLTCFDDLPYRDLGEILETSENLRKYAFNYECLSQCPRGTYTYEADALRKTCVKSCGTGNIIQGNKCVTCGAEGCPPKGVCVVPHRRICKMKKYQIDYEKILSSDDCKVLQGDLVLDDTFWSGDQFCGVESFNLSKLHLFKNVKKITGSLHVNLSPLRNLSFLSNLEIIEGESIMIGNNNHLDYLGLSSLKRIRKFPIIRGEKLCYINEHMLSDLLDPKQDPGKFFINWDYLPSKEFCSESLGKVCDDECATIGGEGACWGPGPKMCYNCRNFNFNNETCVSQCNLDSNFVDGSLCESCHVECDGCSGRVSGRFRRYPTLSKISQKSFLPESSYYKAVD